MPSSRVDVCSSPYGMHSCFSSRCSLHSSLMASVISPTRGARLLVEIEDAVNPIALLSLGVRRRNDVHLLVDLHEDQGIRKPMEECTAHDTRYFYVCEGRKK